MFENMRLAFQGIWSHKLRSILTMLGIIIGIAAIITIVSTIKGTNEQIKENLIGAGNNVVTVQLNQGGYPYDLSWNTPPAGVRTITQETRKELEQVQGAEKVSLYTYRNYAEQVYYRNTQFNGNVMGIDENYLSVYGYQVKSGRGFTEKDYADFRKVVLVDTTAVQTLFGGNNPVGETVELQGDVFTVVGVVTISDSFAPTINSINDYWLYADTSSGTIFLPDAVWPTAYRFDEPQSVAIKVDNTDDMASVGKSAADLLTEKQIADKNSDFDYRSQDMLEQAQQLLMTTRMTVQEVAFQCGFQRELFDAVDPALYRCEVRQELCYLFEAHEAWFGLVFSDSEGVVGEGLAFRGYLAEPAVFAWGLFSLAFKCEPCGRFEFEFGPLHEVGGAHGPA